MSSEDSKGVSNPAYVISTDDGPALGEKDGGKDVEKDLENLDDRKMSALSVVGPERQKWGSPLEFLLSCVSMSVGLGNIWRFPFVAYENGGGAFLIPYIVVLIFIGKPLYYMELCLGQFASKGAVKVWAICPAFKGVGLGQMIATCAVVTYYVSLMGLTVFYFFSSFNSVLPWASCAPEWSSKYCIQSDTNISTLSFNISLAKSSSEEFFLNEVLKTDPNGLDFGLTPPEWRMSLCLLFAWLLVFLVMVKGISGSGKVAYFTALFPYLVLFILLIRGSTLPGAYEGVMFFITPKWERLLEIKVWYAALSQSFFSLSVGFGSITMFSSFNDFKHNVYRDATILSFTDTFTSMLAGFTIFSILGYLAEELGVPVSEVLKGGGSTLAFVSYPDVLARFTFAPQFFATLFFLMLFTLGIGSACGLIGGVITSICDAFPLWKHWVVTLTICVIGYGIGLFYVTPQGQYILTLIDYYGGGFIIFILSAMEVIAVNWVYGIKNFCRDIDFMLDRKTGYYWLFCWGFLIPIVLLVVFLYTVITSTALTHGSYIFGPVSNGMGICLTLSAVSCVPVFFGLAIMERLKKDMSIKDALKDVFKPTAEWAPRDPVMRKQYRDMLAGRSHDMAMEGIDNPDHEMHRF